MNWDQCQKKMKVKVAVEDQKRAQLEVQRKKNQHMTLRVKDNMAVTYSTSGYEDMNMTSALTPESASVALYTMIGWVLRAGIGSNVESVMLRTGQLSLTSVTNTCRTQVLTSL